MDPMTPDRLNNIISEVGLSSRQVAWMIGVTPRTVQFWKSGKIPIPQYAQIILSGYDEGLLPPSWLVSKINAPPC